MRLFRFALLPFAMIAAVSAAPSTDAPSGKKTGTLRILSVADSPPPRFKRMPNGHLSAIFTGYEETPPNALFLKKGSAYTPVPIPQNGVTAPMKSDAKDEGWFVRKTAETDTETAAAAAQKQSREETTEDSWARVAPSVPVDDKDKLLCIFQPDPKLRWYAPKTMLVDVSPAEFAPGDMLVLNLSPYPMMLKVGEGAVLDIAPGARKRIPTPTDTPFLLRAAVRAGDRTIVAYNTEKTTEAGRRALLVAYSAYAKNSASPVFVKFIPFSEPEKDPEKKNGAPERK